MELTELTIQKFHEGLKSGTISCEELVNFYLERIDALDKVEPCLNAVVMVNPAAVQTAREMDRIYHEKGPVGPLHGVPVLLKDNVETFDMPTTAGSLSLKNWNTENDAFITKRLRDAGAIILAKTNLHEFAVWGETVSSILGPSRNPYDRTRTPGGSSGGTGAGIAANFGLVGIGTDTINSIRSPSSACSLCGIRPTVGLVSRSGIVPYSMTQDTAGPIARTVSDAALVLQVIAGYDPADTATEICKDMPPADFNSALSPKGLQGKRIGILKSFFGKEDTNEPVNTALQGLDKNLAEAGAEVVYLDDRIDSDQIVRDISVHLHELKTHLNDYLTSFREKAPVHSIREILDSGKFTPDIEENLRMADNLGISSPEYKDRIQQREELRKLVVQIFNREELDAIAYPHQRQLVCKVGESQKHRNGALASVTGFPAIVVPGGFSEPSSEAPIGVPVGLEFIGEPMCEAKLIEIACGYESNFPVRKPPKL